MRKRKAPDPGALAIRDRGRFEKLYRKFLEVEAREPGTAAIQRVDLVDLMLDLTEADLDRRIREQEKTGEPQ